MDNFYAEEHNDCCLDRDDVINGLKDLPLVSVEESVGDNISLSTIFTSEIQKRIAFVVDTSYSMNGCRITAINNALNKVYNMLMLHYGKMLL